MYGSLISPSLTHGGYQRDRWTKDAQLGSGTVRFVLCEPQLNDASALRSKPKPRDRGDDGQDEQRPDQCRGLVEPEDPDHHRPERADAAPDRISGAHRNGARGEL